MIITQTHAKGQGQRPLDSKVEWKEIEGKAYKEMEVIVLPNLLMRSVIKAKGPEEAINM